MDRRANIFVIGSMVMACTARLDRVPEAGESVRAGAFRIEAGGKGFNVAVGARRLGAAVDGLFAVGDDALGGLARDAFAANGLDPQRLLTLRGGTGAGVGLIDAQGDNRIAVYPGANDRLEGGHAHAAASRIAAADLVTAQFEVGDDVIAEAFALARASGVRTLLNPSPFRPIKPEILKRTDIVVVNRGEAAAFGSTLGLGELEDGPRLVAALFPLGVATLIVTAGAAGATLYEAAGSRFQPAFQVAAVDTTGAGDAFIAGLARALPSGDMDLALRWASAAGAMTAMRFGVLDALPNLAELERFAALTPLRA